MIWHIFKKDWKLYWHTALGLAGIEALVNYLIYRMDEGAPNLRPLVTLILALGLLLGGLLLAAVVHADAIPGVRQDWLVRPIRRRDLLGAKLLFLVLCIAAPATAMGWVGAMSRGFGPGKSLAAALAFGLCQVVTFYIPILAFASVTKNALETIAGAAIGVALCVVLSEGVQVTRGVDAGMTMRSGADWLVNAAAALIVLGAGAAILALQYFRRKTLPSRGVALAAGLAVTLTMLLIPWRPLFAIEQRLSLLPGAGSQVVLHYQPEMRMGKDPWAGLSRPAWMNLRTPVFLPISVTGLPKEAFIRPDRIMARIVSESRTFDLGKALGEKHLITMFVPDDLLTRLKDRPVRLEIDFSMTLMRFSEAHAIPVVSGAQMAPKIGSCAISLNAAGTMLQVQCLEAGPAPPCISYFLEETSTGKRNPPSERCEGSYEPFFTQVTPDPLSRFGTALPFRDLSGLTQYPVGRDELSGSRVVMRVYQPAEHFTRQLVIPEVRLSDLLAR